MTLKQRLFVEAYLGQARCNASEAARIAGYAQPGQRGHELVKNREIQAAIAARTAEVAGSADEVLRTLYDQMRGPREDCFTLGGELDLEALREAGKLHLVKKIGRDRNGNLTIELYDAQVAAIQLGKFHRLWGDRMDDVSKLSDLDLIAEAARLLGGAGEAPQSGAAPEDGAG